MLVLGRIITATKNSFTLSCVDGQVGDEFFISRYYFLDKPVTPPTIMLDAPASEVVFTGLEAGRLYFVKAYRGATEALRDDYPGFFQHYHGYTLPDRVTPSLLTTITETWDGPADLRWIPEGSFAANSQPLIVDKGAGVKAMRMLGQFYANPDSTENYYTWRSKFGMNPDAPISVTAEMTMFINPDAGWPYAGNENGLPYYFYSWWGLNLCTSMQSQYKGVTQTPNADHMFRSYGGGQAEYFNGPGEFLTSDIPPALRVVSGRKYVLRLDYDPIALTVDFYVDGAWQRQDNLPDKFTGPPNVWLGNSFAGDVEHYIEWGEISVTADFNIWGFADTAANLWEGDASIITGSETGFSLLDNAAGGITAQDTMGRMIVYPYMATAVFKAGTFYRKSPAVFPAAGQKYKDVYLIVNQTGSGEARVFLRDYNDVLISDALVPGNSTGFVPTTGQIMTIAVDAIPIDSGLRIHAAATNTVEGAGIAPRLVSAYGTFQVDPDYVPPDPPLPEEEGALKIDAIMGSLSNVLTAQIISGAFEGRYCNFTTGAWVVDYVAPDCDKAFTQAFTGFVRATFNLPATGAKEEVMLTVYDENGNGAAMPDSIFIDEDGNEITETEYLGGGSSLVVFTPATALVNTSTPPDTERIIRGTTHSIPFAVTNADGTPFDLTGWALEFGARLHPEDAAYAITPFEVVPTDIVGGTGFINLTATHTNLEPERYLGELSMTGPGGVIDKPLQVYLKIVASIIHA